MKKTVLLKRLGFVSFAFFLIKGLIWLALIVGFGKIFSNNKMIDTMKVSVYDTYVKKKDGTVMHFDILVPDSFKDTAKIHDFGREYLATKGQEGQSLTAKECRFCHIEQADAEMVQSIEAKGYFIIEMQGCH